MEIIKNKIELGAEKPFKILHITDCHLTPVGDLDNERKHILAGKRFKTFGYEKCLEYCLEITKYGRDNSLPMICTGDLIDFTSYEAFDVLDRECKLNNLIFAVGNHEFSQYVGEAKEDFFYKMQSYTSVQSAIHSPIDFASNIINGVNFITLDNVYYDFTLKQLELLKVECEKPYPIVLCMHTPIYSEDYFTMRQAGDTSEVVYMCGCPDEKIKDYPPMRFEQQRTTKETADFINYVMQSPKVKLILAGHTHRNYECTLENGVPQLITAGTFDGFAREIEII